MCARESADARISMPAPSGRRPTPRRGDRSRPTRRHTIASGRSPRGCTTGCPGRRCRVERHHHGFARPARQVLDHVPAALRPASKRHLRRPAAPHSPSCRIGRISLIEIDLAAEHRRRVPSDMSECVQLNPNAPDIRLRMMFAEVVVGAVHRPVRPRSTTANVSRYGEGNMPVRPSTLWRTCDDGIVRSSSHAASVYAQHAERQAVAAARAVLDVEIRVAAPQCVEQIVERPVVPEVAVTRAVAVARPVAVDPEVVVPLQVVRAHRLDELDEPLPTHARASESARHTCAESGDRVRVGRDRSGRPPWRENARAPGPAGRPCRGRRARARPTRRIACRVRARESDSAPSPFGNRSGSTCQVPQEVVKSPESSPLM